MASRAQDRYQQSFQPVPPLSLAAVIRNMRTGGITDGKLRDQIEAFGGSVADPNRVELSWRSLSRDLAVYSEDAITGLGPGGASLVGTDTMGAFAALAPSSVLAQAGVPILSGLRGNVVVPRVSASSTAYFLPSEGDTVTESNVTIAQTTLSPKTFGVYIEFSRLIDLQSPVEAVLRRDLLAVAAKTMDQYAISGSGSANEPRGILNINGVNSVSGSSLSWDDIMEMRKGVRDASGNEATTAWLCATDTADLLGQRERSSGGGTMILDNGRIDGRPCYISTTVPAGTLILLDAATCLMGVWGGVEMQVNPYTGFSTNGFRAARILVSYDFVALVPKAISITSSVT